MPSELSSLYKNKPVVLWVEDTLTRAWLGALWQDADIGLLVAGSNNAVFAAVRDARAHGHGNVFGFRDRDFKGSNQANWLNLAKNPTVFIPDAFEAENYLLDFAGLAALGLSHNPQQRTAGDLQARAHARAAESLWWMAAKATVADAQEAIVGDFPPPPSLTNPPTLNSIADAQASLEGLLLQGAWGSRVKQWVPALDAAWIASRLTAHEATLQHQLGNGDWRWSWSGKEVFSAVAGHLQTPVTDLAKGLAAHQRQTQTVAQALLDLRTALRSRVGI